ncbi:MAG: NEW3 domain-containing protein, partial [Mycobacteriales bacterium]
RSCTGWPSQVWIDPPKRSVPDGSGFQLQQWTHTFDYSFVSGAGDWRDAGFVHSGHARNHPLHSVVADRQGGKLPAAGVLVSVTPETTVLTAFKATGHPHSRGASDTGQPAGGVAARIYEAHGRPVRARLECVVPLTDAQRADTLESPTAALGGDAIVVPLGGSAIGTVTARPAVAAHGRDPVALIPDREPVQPVYTRYWMHNKGPAPAGNLPLAVHVHPSELTTTAAIPGPFELRITAASDLVDADIDARIRVTAPAGWSARPAEHLIGLAPGDFAELTSTVTPPPDAMTGLYIVRVGADLPDGQAIEDMTVVSIGQRADVANELSAQLAQDVVRVARGERADIDVVISSAARSPLPVEVTLVAPWHSWPALPAVSAGSTVQPGGRNVVTFHAEPPPGCDPSTTWVMAKVMCAGRALYTETVPLVIG